MTNAVNFSRLVALSPTAFARISSPPQAVHVKCVAVAWGLSHLTVPSGRFHPVLRYRATPASAFDEEKVPAQGELGRGKKKISLNSYDSRATSPPIMCRQMGWVVETCLQ